MKPEFFLNRGKNIQRNWNGERKILKKPAKW